MAEEFISLAQAMEGTNDNPEILSLDEAMADPSASNFEKARPLGYFESIRHSFLSGHRSSELDTMGYEALIGKKDYYGDVKPERDAFYGRMQEYKLDDEGWLKKASLSVAGMIPAMAKGTAQGWATAIATGATYVGGAAVIGLAIPAPEEVVTYPASFVAGFGKGKFVGSMQYWYRQGAGSLYSDLREEGIEDPVAKPIAHAAGALYGAIEFAQVDKLIPGSKTAAKKFITSSVRKTMGNMAKKYGTNWLQEITEEGAQEFVLQASKDIASEVAGKTDQKTGAILQKAMLAGWGAVKESAIPMMLLLGPGAAVDIKRGVAGAKELKTKEAKARAEKEAAKVPQVVAPVAKVELEPPLGAPKLTLAAEIEAETKEITKEAPDKVLKQRIKEIRKKYKTPRAKQRAEIKEYQKDLIDIIKSTGIEAKDKSKLLASIKNANTERALSKEANKIQNRAIKYVENTEKKEINKKIEKELKYTKPIKRGAKVVGKYEYEENKMFKDIRIINKLSQAKAQEQLDAMPSENLSEVDLIKSRLLSYKANGMKGSLELYRQVSADIAKLKTFGKLAKNEADFFKVIERKEKAETVSENIARIEGDAKEIKTKTINLYRKGFASIHSMLNSIAGKKIADQLDPESKEQDKKIAVYQKIKDVTSQIAKIYELKHPDMVLGKFQEMAAEKYAIIDREGLTFEISKMELLDIYNAIENDAIKERYYNAFSQEQITSLLANLTDNEMDAAEAMKDSIQEYKEIHNKRHIEMTGLDMGFVEEYWPSSSEHVPEFFDDYKLQGETPSSQKARAKGGKVFPIPRNAWTKLTRHVDQAEHVNHLSREHEGLKRTFSDRKIKNQITNKFGADVYQTLMDQIENISLGRETQRIDAISSVIGKLVNNWVTAKVAFPNFNVFAKQLLSVINYADNMPMGEWAGGFVEGLTTPRKTFDYMWNNSGGFLEARFNKGYSEAVTEAIRGAEQISKNKHSWTKGLSALVRSGDISAIVYGGYSYVKHLEKTMSKEAAFEQFKKDTLKSQQSGMRSGLSQFQNTKNPIVRLFLAFKNTSNQYFRKQVDAFISYGNKDISAKQLLKTTMIYSVINPMMYAGTGIAMRNGMKLLGETLFGAYHDDEDDAESIITDLMIQIAVNPFMAIPLIDDLSQFAARKVAGKWAYKAISTPLFDDIETAARKMAKEEITLIDYLESFGTVAEVTTAAPVKTILRIYKYLTGE